MLTMLIGRETDVQYVRRCVAGGACCSLVGVSNLGKSALLRHLGDFTSSDTGTFVYIDCNQMPERTARAFYISIWRALAHAVQTYCDDAEANTRAHRLNEEIIQANDATQFAFNFERGLALALDYLPRPLVLCLDDFDEAYQHLEPQAFLNLRSLKDRYGDTLVYVTATERELARLTTTREQGEFYELIAPRVRFLHPMELADTRRFCEVFAAREHVTFSNTDLAFIYENANGHPGLVQAVCYALGAVTGATVRDAHQDRVIHQHVQENLVNDANVQSECAKIWNDLESDERDALLYLHPIESSVPTPREGEHPAPRAESDSLTGAQRGLRSKFIVHDTDEGPVIFARLFADYVRRQKFKQQPNVRGVYVDVDAGDVWVDGKPIEALSDLEYRLILFLYGRLERVCDKYAIVESVWGEDYVDKVDDARIEKLVSRVRQKIEPDPARPRYLLSLRGRGYKLVR